MAGAPHSPKVMHISFSWIWGKWNEQSPCGEPASLSGTVRARADGCFCALARPACSLTSRHLQLSRLTGIEDRSVKKAEASPSNDKQGTCVFHVP